MNPMRLSWWRMLDVFAAAEKGLVLTSSGLLALAGIAGYSVYTGFMRKNPNTMKRLINVLNGQFALAEKAMGAVIFCGFIKQNLGYDEESNFYLIISQIRISLAFYEGIVLFWIAVATLMKKFYPNDYLDLSEKWTPWTALKDLLVILLIHALITAICLAAGNFEWSFHKKIQIPVYAAIFLLLLILTLIIQIRLMIVENKKSVQMKMNKLFAKNTVAPTDDEAEGEEEANDEVEDDTGSQDNVSTNVGFLTLLATALVFMINIICGITMGWKRTKYLRETVSSIRIALTPFIWIHNNVALQEYASDKMKGIMRLCKCKCG